jgi:ketosteroid isomerase-like protein
MPSQTVVREFIARVVSGAHADAIEEYYTADASMRENFNAPRVGRDTLVARERATLSRAKAVTTTCVEPVFISGDHVVVRWIFEFTWLDGRSSRMEELAYQRWQGEQIAEETFFYDPVQLAKK